jgi:hypothetical protein
MPPVYDGDGSNAPRAGVRDHVVAEVVRGQPGRDHRVPHRQQTVITGRVANIGQGHQHPVAALPFGVRMPFALRQAVKQAPHPL